VLVAHAFAVVADLDAELAGLLSHEDLHRRRARVPRVLQQLTHEHPRVRPVAIRLDPRAPAKVDAAPRLFSHASPPGAARIAGSPG
jgi:hypothetical protein